MKHLPARHRYCRNNGASPSASLWMLSLAVSLTLIACGGDEPRAATDAGTNADSGAALDSGGSVDVAQADATQAGIDDAGAADKTDTGKTDTGKTDTGKTDTGKTDAGVSTDSSATPDAELAKLVIEDQALTTKFNTITLKLAALPPKYLKLGKVKIYHLNLGKKGALAGELKLEPKNTYTNKAIVLTGFVVSLQTFVAEMVYPDGKPFIGADGTALRTIFQVTGDLSQPELTVNSQTIDGTDLYVMTVERVVVPDRFAVGLWVAVYEDKDGKPGKLRGKKMFAKGIHSATEFKLTNKLLKTRVMHAALRRGTSSGAWSSKGEIIKDLGTLPLTAEFKVDSPVFHPILEIEDQTLVKALEIKIKSITVPKEHYGGWLALYSDKAGKVGKLLGRLYYKNGTKTDKIVKLKVPQQGTKTIHAVLYAGQKWDVDKNVVMKSQDGGEMKLTFTIGAASLSYIVAEPYTTRNPRHVMVTKVYSYNRGAWVVLARDDNGKPGTIIARKKILKRFSGNVRFSTNSFDFMRNGSPEDYLKGVAGTFRRCARGIDKMHVLLYEEWPIDGKFTYKPGGTEDVPVLDANGKPVTAVFTVTVKGSIDNSQKWSKRYYWQCPLNQHVANPTMLPVDCRCHGNLVSLDFPECKLAIAWSLKMQMGKGPRAMNQTNGGFYSGFTEPSSNELIAILQWTDFETKWPQNKISIRVGAVMAIDMDTGDRRIIGGRYKYPDKGIKDIGTGPVLSYPFQIQKGPKGLYYIASFGFERQGASLIQTIDIISMDPKTGNRKYVWRSNHLGYNFDNKPNPYGHCATGQTKKYGYKSVRIGRKSFNMDKKGNFYLTFAHNSKSADSYGKGVLRISANGKKCEIVTSSDVGAKNLIYKGKNVGTGPKPQAGPSRGMLIHGDKLYTTDVMTNALYEIELATGNRKIVHEPGVQDTNSGSSGTQITWDAHRNLIWQAGLSGTTLMYNPANGKSEPLWCPQWDRNFMGIACLHKGAWGLNTLPMERGMWIHPTNKRYMYVVNYHMIARVDLFGGTSDVLSF